MAEAGYSGTPLQKKLGLKPGAKVAFVGEVPEGYGSTFDGLEVRKQARRPLDAVHLFTRTRADLEKRAPALMKAIVEDGSLWVSWPKRTSGVATDLTEQTLRDVILPTGWVDTKVCAVDETWSGLRFVRRITERAGTGRTPGAGRR